jgi:hypothetical protein
MVRPAGIAVKAWGRTAIAGGRMSRFRGGRLCATREGAFPFTRGTRTMAKVKCRAVIMDYAGEGENVYEFEADEAIFQMPADEVVETFMRHIDKLQILNEPVRYELNAANRFPEKRLVSAMGSLLLRNGSRIPFIAMIGPS